MLSYCSIRAYLVHIIAYFDFIFHVRYARSRAHRYSLLSCVFGCALWGLRPKVLNACLFETSVLLVHGFVRSASLVYPRPRLYPHLFPFPSLCLSPRLSSACRVRTQCLNGGWTGPAPGRCPPGVGLVPARCRPGVCLVGLVFAWFPRGARLVLAWCWFGVDLVLAWCWPAVGLVSFSIKPAHM